MKKNVILTFDIEYWSDSNFLKKYLPPDDFTDHFEESVDLILNLLKKYNAAATFFVLGKVAQRFPEVIKKIDQAGYEISIHGYSHTPLTNLTKQQFENELITSIKIIKNLINKNIIGFRAPAFSLNKSTAWLFDVLEKNQIIYDSSFFPMSLGIYGEKLMTITNSKIKELPVAIWQKGILKIPVAGGIYFRMLPYPIFKFLLKQCLKSGVPLLYFHNHELINFKPDLKKCPRWKKWLKFYGINKSLIKLEKLLKDFQGRSISQYYNFN